MRKIIFIFFLFPVSLVFAQQFNITIQKTIGGNDVDALNDAILLPNNQILMGGYTRSGISYDKTVDFWGGASDGWIVKLDSSLSDIWQKELGGADYDDIKKLLLLSDGNYLCIGFSSSPVSGNKTVDTIGGWADIWVVKLDTSGNILWQNVYGGTGNEYYYLSAVELADKNIIIGCETNSDSSGTKTENSRGEYDYWVFKIDSAGNQLWDKTIGGSGTDELVDIVVNPNGNILLTGTSDSPISGEKTEDTYGWEDYWLVEMDSTGNILWDKTYGGDDIDYAVGGGVYYDNAYFIFGMSRSGISGNKTTINYGDTDYWLLKINEQGQMIWDKTFGGTLLESGSSIIVSSQDNILITGASYSSISGNKTEQGKGSNDYWLLSLDLNGTIQSQIDIGGSDADGYNLILEKASNEFVIVGGSESGVSGDKTDYCRGYSDFWVVELNTTVGINMAYADNQIAVYPNPTTGDITFVLPMKTKNRVITFFNEQGMVVKKEAVPRQLNHISIRNLPAGLYFYRITENNKLLKTGKIVKQ